MMLGLRRWSAMLLFGLLAIVSLGARADVSLSVFPGWNAVSSTNWSVKTPIIQNWRQMLARWADGKDCDSDTCSSAGWADLVARVKAAGDVMAEMRMANTLINDTSAHPYTEDGANWKTDEYWETPYEFLKKSGDDEDFTIAKYFLLKAAGVPAANMQIDAVRVKSLGGRGHAILAVRTDVTHVFILDNRVAQVIDVNLVAAEFRPVLGVNEATWWSFAQ